MSTSTPNALIPALSVAFTDNGGVTEASSGDARLDLFYGLKEHLGREAAQKLTLTAWAESPQDTLKLIFYTLDVREGKSVNQVALYALQALWPAHPKTVLGVLQHVPQFGCWRDLATFLALFRLDEERLSKLKRLARMNQARFGRVRTALNGETDHRPYHRSHPKPSSDKPDECNREYDELYAQMRAHPIPTALMEEVVRLFSTQLSEDLAHVIARTGKASLAAKWMPSQGKSLDKQTGLYDAVALKMYNQPLEYDTGGALLPCSLHKARNHLRKTYLSSLRAHMHVVEVNMSAQNWGKINYSAVPSLSMHRNAPAFEAHDQQRYSDFVLQAAGGNAKINVAVLKPHMIVNSVEQGQRIKTILANAQWDAYVQHIKSAGTLSPALAVVDVSGSMVGLPMEVACALGLLLAEVTPEPWHDYAITFSAIPQFHHIVGTNLSERYSSLQEMEWGMNTDFLAVFELILGRAQAHNVPRGDMRKTLFVFSDMQFDAADGSRYKGRKQTHFEEVKDMYEQAGYDMPQLVFWNLAGNAGGADTRAPVTLRDDGTALVSGFSANLLKLFLEGAAPEDWVMVDQGTEDDEEKRDHGDDEEMKDEAEKPKSKKPKMDPMAIMRKAIDHERFDVLQVLD